MTTSNTHSLHIWQWWLPLWTWIEQRGQYKESFSISLEPLSDVHKPRSYPYFIKIEFKILEKPLTISTRSIWNRNQKQWSRQKWRISNNNAKKNKWIQVQKKWDKATVSMKTEHDIQKKLMILYNKRIINEND